MLGQTDRVFVAGKVRHRKSRVETRQAIGKAGALIWTLESVASGCSGMRLPCHEGFPEKSGSVLKLKKKNPCLLYLPPHLCHAAQTTAHYTGGVHSDHSPPVQWKGVGLGGRSNILLFLHDLPARGDSLAASREGGGGSKGQVWTHHLAPAAPAFTRPSSPSQFIACSTCHLIVHWCIVLLRTLPD